MKELSIEEKAKRYDIALDKIKRLLGTGSSCSREELEYVFPELKERKEIEDDKVVKHLITLFKNDYGKNSNARFAGIKVKDIIAWLEKQGDKDKLIKELGEYKVKYTQEVLSQQLKKLGEQKQELLTKEKALKNSLFVEQKPNCCDEQKPNPCENCSIATNNCQNFPCTIRDGEQKPTDKVEPKFKVGDIIRHKEQGFTCKIIAVDTEYRLSGCNGNHLPFDSQDAYELVEQKPAWSEEDENMLQSILDEYKSMLTEKRNWLKSLRPQNRLKWSNEDETMFVNLVAFLEGLCGTPKGGTKTYAKWLKERYKYALPMPHWKPSIAQLNALSIVSKGNVPDDIEAIVSLYNDLKKLREE